MNRWKRLYKKFHRWPGLIISFILLYYSVTGILMNHREFFSGTDVNRNALPEQFKYRNWNNSAVKANLIINADSILLYGNIGIWLTDSAFSEYRSFNEGFPEGEDNRKIYDLHRSSDGNLYAATLFGLYAYDPDEKRWEKFPVDVDQQRFVGIESIGDSLYIFNRSYLFTGLSEGINSKFQKKELKAPPGYEKEVSLFETIWQIHSGEILGLPGKLFVDLMGIITIFLSLTGIIYFFFPGWIKRRMRGNRPAKTIIRFNKWSLKWHNKTGAWIFAFLIILFFTGMFLRPPLLIAIANANVKPIKYSHLDQPNPWYDKLRDIHYDEERNKFLISTSEGMYFLDRFSLEPQRVMVDPPVSIMGINVFEPYDKGAYLIGSFSGLFLWHPSHHEILNYAKGTVYQGETGGRPIGDYKVSGMLIDVSGNRYMIDYEHGVIALWHDNKFPKMPEEIVESSRMSLWNVSLEIHTGRFFQFLTGSFYILIVPLVSLTSVIVVLSGYLLWRKKYKKKKS